MTTRHVLAAFALAALLAQWAHAGTPFDADRPGWGKACNTYENRARFMPREQPVDFVVLVAEACGAAMASLDSGRPAERDAAARLLSRLAELKRTIKQMNVERVFGADAGPRSTPLRQARRLAPVGGVTQTGEYLIAHHIGVVAALEEWLDTGAPFSLASR